jgi:hypothetical protein
MQDSKSFRLDWRREEVKDKEDNVVTIYSTCRPTIEIPGDTEEAKVEKA